MSTRFSPEAAKARLAELDDEAARIRALAAPLRAQRDALLAQMEPLRAEERALIAQYRQIEEPLFDLEQERALLSRALGSKDRRDLARARTQGDGA